MFCDGSSGGTRQVIKIKKKHSKSSAVSISIQTTAGGMSIDHLKVPRAAEQHSGVTFNHQSGLGSASQDN